MKRNIKGIVSVGVSEMGVEGRSLFMTSGAAELLAVLR